VQNAANGGFEPFVQICRVAAKVRYDNFEKCSGAWFTEVIERVQNHKNDWIDELILRNGASKEEHRCEICT